MPSPDSSRNSQLFAEIGPGLGELSGREQDGRQRDQHDHSADQGGEIGVDALDADLGEDRGQRGEDGGKERPDLPGGE
ncbi:hypothetical protein ACVI1K_002166 [Bradyrhizobium sp. USDA 4508]